MFLRDILDEISGQPRMQFYPWASDHHHDTVTALIDNRLGHISVRTIPPLLLM
jgi:hypothetical protein